MTTRTESKRERWLLEDKQTCSRKVCDITEISVSNIKIIFKGNKLQPSWKTRPNSSDTLSSAREYHQTNHTGLVGDSTKWQPKYWRHVRRSAVPGLWGQCPFKESRGKGDWPKWGRTMNVRIVDHCGRRSGIVRTSTAIPLGIRLTSRPVNTSPVPDLRQCPHPSHQ